MLLYNSMHLQDLDLLAQAIESRERVFGTHGYFLSFKATRSQLEKTPNLIRIAIALYMPNLCQSAGIEAPPMDQFMTYARELVVHLAERWDIKLDSHWFNEEL